MKMQPTVANMRDHVAQLSALFKIVVLYDEDLPMEKADSIQVIRNGLAQTDDDKELSKILDMMGTDMFVRAAPINDETTYAVVMHEIGHHVAPNGRSYLPDPKRGAEPSKWFDYYASKLVCEEAAWEWARHYIEQMFHWSVPMEMVKEMALESYRESRRTGRPRY